MQDFVNVAITDIEQIHVEVRGPAETETWATIARVSESGMLTGEDNKPSRPRCLKKVISPS